jgi:hypothetical protein
MARSAPSDTTATPVPGSSSSVSSHTPLPTVARPRRVRHTVRFFRGAGGVDNGQGVRGHRQVPMKPAGPATAITKTPMADLRANESLASNAFWASDRMKSSPQRGLRSLDKIGDCTDRLFGHE